MARARGRIRPQNLSHLIDLSHARHGLALKLGLLTITPPASWDSRALGLVGPVKDQGQCGSCWDFSGTGICEIAYAKSGQPGLVFSEEYTLDCGQNGGCNGDDNTTVLAWAKATGLPLTSAYGPYKGGCGFFGSCQYTTAMKLYPINDWGFADSNGGQGVTPMADIKAAIMANGAVGCAIAADDAFENNPPGTVFQDSGSTDMNHDIILCGWDDSKQAWLLRNSWGTEWCDAGYCWIEYGANQVGTEAVFAVVTPSK